jgi:hypothetical protein
VTFLVSGIWHGANWTFIVWGCMHGVLQIIEKALGWQKYEGSNGMVKAIRILVTFLLVNFAWIFFRMPSIGEAWGVIYRMFTDIGTPNLSDLGGSIKLVLVIGIAILIIKDLRDEYFSNKMQFLEARPVRWAIYVGLFCMVLLFGALDGGQFIYVNF